MKQKAKFLILGGGISGLASSYFIGHENCLILEGSDNLFGILRSPQRNGFTWDRGPHVSFTKSEIVRALFEGNVNDEYFEKSVVPSNYWKGDWIDHPVQAHLHQVG